MFFTWLSVKQNIGHVRLLGSHALGKLVLLIWLSVKQILSNVRFLESHALGKLMLFMWC